MNENKQFIARLAFDMLTHLGSQGGIKLNNRFIEYNEDKNQENIKLFLSYYQEIYDTLSEKLK